MGPGVSKVGDNGKIPSVGHLFFVVFNPTIPLSEAGILTEPPVSVPMAKEARPEAQREIESGISEDREWKRSAQKLGDS